MADGCFFSLFSFCYFDKEEDANVVENDVLILLMNFLKVAVEQACLSRAVKDIRERATFDGCQYALSWLCYSGNCGSVSRSQKGILDRSTNAPQSNGQWCETEKVTTRDVPSNKPFQMR